MKPSRAYLLLEVLVGLALLAALGAWLVRLQGAAVRQYRQAEQRALLAAQVEHLLWTWSETGTAVSLPATGQFDARTQWRRAVQPVRVAGLLTTQVSVIVTRAEPGAAPVEIYRVDWLLSAPEGGEPEAP